MKAFGYRKQGARFCQEVSTKVLRLVNIQSSAWNVCSDGKFTINLGVYHRDLAKLHDVIPEVESPLVQHCIVQQRIGFLMPVGRDYWWSINAKTDLTAIGNEVAGEWEKYGKPWLDAKSSLEGARVHLEQQKEYFLAAMASFAMGKHDDTHHWLDKAIEDCPPSKDRIDAWRRAYLTTLAGELLQNKTVK
jgi:hypothetical protein